MNKYLARLLVVAAAFIVAWSVVSLRRSIEHAWKWKQSQAEIKKEVLVEIPIASPSPPESLDQLRSLSPYDIVAFIKAHPQSNLAELWQRLGIHRLNFADDWQSDTTQSQFLAKCNGCDAESFEYDLDDDPGNEVLLRIGDFSESCRYLVFKSPGRSDHWKLIGHIDHDFGRYRMPEHLIVLSNGRPWLVIQQQGQSGAGVALYFDRLFLVEHGALKEVMRYTSAGHQSGFSGESEREFSGRILDCTLRNGVARIEIEFHVTYFNEETVLFTKRRKALFVGQPGHKILTLNRSHSALSQNEIDAVFDVDSLTNQDFLKYNFAELSQLATGTDWNRRKWLAQFLRGCDTTPEWRRLHSLLGHG